MLDVAQGYRQEAGVRPPAVSLFLLSCISNDLSSYTIFYLIQ